jgi:NAD(P)-dependent dehydrogenase (short-subunit alcohol dehydrogenase family)
MSLSQIPIRSGFSAASTAEDVIQGINLTGKTAIVTGGYSGIGRETARVLRGAGARVIVPARDRARATTALEGIDVEIEVMDLMAPGSIDAFAARFIDSGSPLHILVNSAGIMACPLERDARGYESQFATNHLGHFQLVARLWPSLVQGAGARVVSVSSWAHHCSPVVFDDPHFERRDYDPWLGYGQSKTANVLFALELDRRSQAQGVRAFSVHPGAIIGTSLQKHLTQQQLWEAGVVDEDGQPILDPSRNMKTVEQGAATSVWCATSPQLNGIGGVYCENSEVALLESSDPDGGWNIGGSTHHSGVLPYAVDPDGAQKLWALSEQLLGLKFTASA